jgi:hypothetical protein
MKNVKLWQNYNRQNQKKERERQKQGRKEGRKERKKERRKEANKERKYLEGLNVKYVSVCTAPSIPKGISFFYQCIQNA